MKDKQAMKNKIIPFEEVDSFFNTSQIYALIDEKINVSLYDFGKGVQPAHRHPNGFGIIENTAKVSNSVYVALDCLVSGNSVIRGNVSILDGSTVEGDACIQGEGKGVTLDNYTNVEGNVRISGSYKFNNANIGGLNKFQNTGKRIVNHVKLFRI